MKPAYLIEYKDCFDDNVEDYKNYLTGIGKKDIVTLTSYFLSTSIWGQASNEVSYQVNNWFSRQNQELLREVNAKLENLENRKLIVINPFSILKLLEYVLTNCKEETEISEKDFEINMFKAILSLNQEFNIRGDIVEKSVEAIEEPNQTIFSLFTLAFCDFDLRTNKVYHIIISQFIKASLLFDFLENHNDITNLLLEEFYKKEKVSHWKEYLIKYFPIYSAIINSGLEKPIDILVRKDADFKETCDFLDSLIINDENNLDDYDFITCRSKPFYKTGEGEYRIIHLLFAIEKLYNGLYFALSSINNDLPNKISEFRGFFCDEFSERKLVYDILDLSFPKKHLKLSGESIKSKVAGIRAEPDYYVRKKNKIYLFESKDVLIDKKTKQSHDFRQIEKALKTKFYYYIEKGVRKNVGVMQLIYNVQRILKSEDKWDENNNENVYIYPILLVHYNVYNTPGLNHLVNNWFVEELNKLKSVGLNTDKVKNLVIIDLEVFILNHERFQNNNLCLDYLIDKYISETGMKHMSFSSYVSEYVNKKYQFLLPKLFRKLGFSLFE